MSARELVATVTAEWRRRIKAIGRDTGSYRQCADELDTAFADFEAPEPARPVEGLRLEEREDDALIAAPHWQYGSIAICRRPKLMSNEEWRPIAERIIAALSAQPEVKK